MEKFFFDEESYNANIELLLDYAKKEYEKHFTELPAYQDNNLKTYLWISAALTGLQLTTIDKLGTMPNSSVFYVTISIILSFLVFCIGIDSLRVREKSIFGLEKYNDLTERAYEYAKCSGSRRKLQLCLIDFFETAIDSEIKNNVWRGGRLRIMSILLLFSGISLAMTIITYFAG
jgi:hypothetical protein